MEAPLGGGAPKPRTERPVVRSGTHPLPPGALPGDPDRQPFSHVAPRLIFVDRPKRCRGCGGEFVLTARDQKRWCEALGLRPDTRAARCPACLRSFLRERGLANALSDASRALSEAPRHAPAVLAYARASVAHARRFGHAPLDAALAALAMLDGPGADGAEASYWAGRCLESANRLRLAGAAYRKVLEARPPAPARLRRAAMGRLARVANGD